MVDLKNMIQCDWCSKWTHAACLGIKPDQLITLLKVKTEYPYQCKVCRTLLHSQWGKIVKDLDQVVDNKLKEVAVAVSQTNENVSQIDNRLQAVEQSVIFKDHDAFQVAVNLQIEKFSSNMKVDLEAAIDKQVKKVSNDIKTDLHDKYVRRNRIVIFGLGDSHVELVKSLGKELGIKNVNIKKTFRIKVWYKKTAKFRCVPPLNVEFHCERDKYAFLNKSVREKLGTLPEESEFHFVSIAPDRSFKERIEYRLLRQEMNERNDELKSLGEFSYMWIIKKMSLTQVEVI